MTKLVLINNDEFVAAPAQIKRRGMPIAIIALLLVLAAVMFQMRPGLPKKEADTGTRAAPSQPLEATKPVLFRYGFTSGDSRRYDLSMDMKLSPAEGGGESIATKITAAMGLDVVKRLDDGSAVLDLSISNVRFQPDLTNGQLPDGTKMRVTLAPDGRITYYEGNGGGILGAPVQNSLTASGTQATDGAQSQFLFPRFPSEAVKEGDHWTESSTFELPFGDEKLKVTADGTHKGYQSSRYGQAAQIHYHATTPMDFSFSLADLAKFAQRANPGADPIAQKSGLDHAVMKLAGEMSMDADTLILPKTSDLVSLNGTMKTSMRLGLEGIPSGEFEGQAREVAYNVTMAMSIVRTDGLPTG